jgi:hypothetical protein
MKRGRRGSWWGLYALIPVTALLLVLADKVRVGEPLHQILLIAVVVVVAVLALLWSERHADLLGSEGVDAQAEASELAETGIASGRFLPSITARQAHYRQVMFSRHSPETATKRRLPVRQQ